MNKHKDAASMDQIKTAKTSNFLTEILILNYQINPIIANII